MPLGTPTTPTPVVASASGSTVTTASFTPSANSLLLASLVVKHDSPPLQPSSIGDSAGLSWTLLTDLSEDTGAGNPIRQRVYAAATGASPGSMTVTHNSPHSPSPRVSLQLVEITGTTIVPVNFAGATSGTGDPSVVLSPAPAASSTLISLFGGAAAATFPVDPPTGFTELEDTFPTAGAVQMESAYDAGSGATTNSWTTTGANTCASVIEVAAPSGGRAYAYWNSGDGGTGTFVGVGGALDFSIADNSSLLGAI